MARRTQTSSAAANPPGASPVSFGSQLAARPKIIAALLALATLAVFSPVAQHQFINYDDPDYVTENPRVQNGLSLANVKWAFQTGHASNWHPITWLSHMLDCQFFGLRPGAHHLVNVVFHAMNTVLVFLLWRGLTGAVWRSAIVAALFGLHPLHVESVAWISERKDVLSACFGLLTLLAYARYAKRNQEAKPKPTVWYGLALVCFALGLMSKPMLVTLPFVLLLLDFWPLERLRGLNFSHARSKLFPLVFEKTPFLLLSLASSVITFLVQREGGAVQADFPFGVRLANALVSCARYLGGMFWPQKMSVLYPHPGVWPSAMVLAAFVLVLGIFVPALLGARKRPHLIVGWLWFCGMLVPVIGLVQVGVQSMADRYTYLPSIGLFVMLVWFGNELVSRFPQRATLLKLASATVLIVLTATTWRQLRHWRNTETLFRHAIGVTQNNYVAHSVLGLYLSDQGRTDEAVKHYQMALHINPAYADAHNNIGLELAMRGRLDEAIGYFRDAVRLNPRLASAHGNLGLALAGQRKLAEAIVEYETSLRLKPDDARVRSNFAMTLADLGRVTEAIAQYQTALALMPNSPEIHCNLGITLANQGQREAAAAQFVEALRLKPDYTQAQQRLRQLSPAQSK